MIPSIYRAMSGSENAAMSQSEQPVSKANFLVSCNLGWSRVLYDWYLKRGFEPLIVDADDYMTSREFMRQLCIKTGLDPDHLVYNWPKATEEELKKIQPPVAAKILKTLLSSDGIVPGLDARDLNMNEEVAKWKKEFGEETTSLLIELVDRAVPQYEVPAQS